MNKTGHGGFQIGHPGCGGRKKGSKNVFNSDSRKAMLQALKIVEGDKTIGKGKSFWQHVAERAYKSDTVLCAVLKKLCPDLLATEFDVAKGVIKKVKFEIVENAPKKDLEELEDDQ